MCGIAVIIGPDPSATVFDSMLDAIASRGKSGRRTAETGTDSAHNG